MRLRVCMNLPIDEIGDWAALIDPVVRIHNGWFRGIPLAVAISLCNNYIQDMSTVIRFIHAYMRLPYDGHVSLSRQPGRPR